MKKFKSRLVGAAALAMGASLALSACSGGGAATTEGGGSDDGTTKVGYLVYDIGLDPWMNVYQTTIEEAAEEAGVELTVADGKNDIATQNGAIDQFIASGMDAIIIAPGDPESLVSASLKAKEAGIPVFSTIFGISDDAEVVSTIASDEEALGKMQGEILVEALGGEGKVGLQTGALGNAAEIGRSAGIESVFEENPGMEIIENQSSGWQYDKSLALTQDWLSKHAAGEIDAIVAQGPELVGGAEWAKAQGRDDVIFVALDYPEDVRQAIIDGTVLATLNQNPKVIAEATLETVLKYLDGEDVETHVAPDVAIIDSSNVEDVPAAY